jgi:two-component system invasion response regulator UvrY
MSQSAKSEVTVMLVDDHPIVREGYRRLLERQEGMRVVAEADCAGAAYQAYRRAAPDVVVMDLSLPGASGLEAVRHIRQWDSRARILVFTMHGGAAFALKAFEAGARGYVTKSSEAAELVRAVRAVANGGRALSPDIAREIAAERLAQGRSIVDVLGPRETEVLTMVASGATSQDIARALNISVKTVQNYHYHIKDKIGARTDAHLVWLAIGAGLIEADSKRWTNAGDATKRAVFDDDPPLEFDAPPDRADDPER